MLLILVLQVHLTIKKTSRCVMDLLKKTVSSVQCNLAADSRYLSKQKSQRTRPNVKEYHDRAVFLQRWTCFTLTTNILSMVSICKQKYEYNCKLCTNMYFILLCTCSNVINLFEPILLLPVLFCQITGFHNFCKKCIRNNNR